jgi:predicted DNA-binding transcriptional regulator AlpA
MQRTETSPNIPTEDRLMRKEQILEIMPICYSNLRSRIAKGEFPKPIKIGSIYFWKASTIYKYIDELHTKQQS